MFERILIFHPEMGVYLGNCLGLGFWSKLDPGGQDAAVTFESAEEAINHAASWDDLVLNLKFASVKTCARNYATILEIEAAGLSGWDPKA